MSDQAKYIFKVYSKTRRLLFKTNNIQELYYKLLRDYRNRFFQVDVLHPNKKHYFFLEHHKGVLAFMNYPSIIYKELLEDDPIHSFRSSMFSKYFLKTENMKGGEDD